MQNNEGAYERFRRRQQVLQSCNVKKTGMFIENSEMSTNITVDRTQDSIPVAMVMSFKEGADELFVFSYSDADFEEGDYYTWNDQYGVEHHYFTSELLTIIKEVRYKKFKSFECNVRINNSIWGHFKSSMRSIKDSGFSANREEDKILPMLIAPKNDILYMGAYINIQNQTWRIVEMDTYTLPYIGFYTLERSMNNIIEDIKDDPNVVYLGQKITLDTYGGKCIIYDNNAKIVTRNFDSVEIEVIDSKNNILTIDTWDEDNNVVTHTYDIKEYI